MANYKMVELELPGAYIIECFAVGDSRGGFIKCYEKEAYSKAGIEFNLYETFVSNSAKNVIRGMHFQLNAPQTKLVSVLRGKIYDVIVDLRRTSPTYKQWLGVELSRENHKALVIPRGFAHGFMSLEDDTIVMYQCDGAYDKETDTGIRYDDQDIGIQWPIDEKHKTIHSERDLGLMSFEEFRMLIGCQWDSLYEDAHL